MFGPQIDGRIANIFGDIAKKVIRDFLNGMEDGVPGPTGPIPRPVGPKKGLGGPQQRFKGPKKGARGQRRTDYMGGPGNV